MNINNLKGNTMITLKGFAITVIIAFVILTDAYFNKSHSEPYLNINLVSKHISDKEYNEENYGLGVTWQDHDRLISAGFFKNSEYNDSTYLLYGFERSWNKYIRGRVMLGGATGYSLPVTPVIWPSLSFGDVTRVNVGVLPAYEDSPWTFTFQVELKI